MWWRSDIFGRKRPALERRAALIRAVRAVFDGQGFLEVETPALQVMPTADLHIRGIRADTRAPDGARHERYLHCSPEFAMKKLLVAGLPKIYQICKVFRDSEGGRLHSPEFTMLEWYRAGADYRALIADCQALLRGLGVEQFRHAGRACDAHGAWQVLSVSEAFQQYSNIDLSLYLNDLTGFSKVISDSGIRVAADDGWDDLFFRVMAARIEPHLGFGVPTVLMDYPAAMAALSRKKPDDPRYAERFELYVCGVELANAYTELTDAAEQRVRFEADMAEKHRIYEETYPLDEDFLKALEQGMPESAGIALGLDRLVMLAVGAENIEDVLWTEKP